MTKTKSQAQAPKRAGRAGRLIEVYHFNEISEYGRGLTEPGGYRVEKNARSWHVFIRSVTHNCIAAAMTRDEWAVIEQSEPAAFTIEMLSKKELAQRNGGQ